MLRVLTDNSIAVTVIFIVLIQRVHKVISVYNKVRTIDNCDKKLLTLVVNNKSVLILWVGEIKTGWRDEL